MLLYGVEGHYILGSSFLFISFLPMDALSCVGFFSLLVSCCLLYLCVSWWGVLWSPVLFTGELLLTVLVCDLVGCTLVPCSLSVQ